MIEVRPLNYIEKHALDSLITGYISGNKYWVNAVEFEGHFSVTLQLTPLPKPYIKHYDPPDAVAYDHYRQVLPLGFSFGAYEDQECIGVTIAEPRQWNKSLWVWELHVKEIRRRLGIGSQLVESLVQKGRAAGLRTLVCETQNTNVPAIDFYRKQGFKIEGVDISYYSNDDYPEGEIALFMKKRLA